MVEPNLKSKKIKQEWRRESLSLFSSFSELKKNYFVQTLSPYPHFFHGDFNTLYAMARQTHL